MVVSPLPVVILMCLLCKTIALPIAAYAASFLLDFLLLLTPLPLLHAGKTGNSEAAMGGLAPQA